MATDYTNADLDQFIALAAQQTGQTAPNNVQSGQQTYQNLPLAPLDNGQDELTPVANDLVQNNAQPQLAPLSTSDNNPLLPLVGLSRNQLNKITQLENARRIREMSNPDLAARRQLEQQRLQYQLQNYAAQQQRRQDLANLQQARMREQQENQNYRQQLIDNQNRVDLNTLPTFTQYIGDENAQKAYNDLPYSVKRDIFDKWRYQIATLMHVNNPSIDVEQQADILDKITSDKPQEPTRTGGAVFGGIGDALVNAASGVASGASGVAAQAQLATGGNPNEGVAGYLKDTAQSLHNLQSDKATDQDRQLAYDLSLPENQGLWGQLKTNVTDLSPGTVGNAVGVAAPLIAGAALTDGTSLIPTALGIGGTAAVTGAEFGGMAAQERYKNVMDNSTDRLQRIVPDWNNYLDRANGDPQKAKELLAHDVAVTSDVGAAIPAAAFSVIPGVGGAIGKGIGLAGDAVAGAASKALPNIASAPIRGANNVLNSAIKSRAASLALEPAAGAAINTASQVGGNLGAYEATKNPDELTQGIENAIAQGVLFGTIPGVHRFFSRRGSEPVPENNSETSTPNDVVQENTSTSPEENTPASTSEETSVPSSEQEPLSENATDTGAINNETEQARNTNAGRGETEEYRPLDEGSSNEELKQSSVSSEESLPDNDAVLPLSRDNDVGGSREEPITKTREQPENNISDREAISGEKIREPENDASSVNEEDIYRPFANVERSENRVSKLVNTHETIDRFVKADDPQISHIYQTLKTAFGDKNLPRTAVVDFPSSESEIFGAYHPSTDTILVSRNASPFVYAHEFLHSMTANGLDKLRTTKPNEYNSLLNILNSAKDQTKEFLDTHGYPTEDIHALEGNSGDENNVHELLAEVFSPTAAYGYNETKFNINRLSSEDQAFYKNMMKGAGQRNVFNTLKNAISKIVSSVSKRPVNTDTVGDVISASIDKLHEFKPDDVSNDNMPNKGLLFYKTKPKPSSPIYEGDTFYTDKERPTTAELLSKIQSKEAATPTTFMRDLVQSVERGKNPVKAGAFFKASTLIGTSFADHLLPLENKIMSAKVPQQIKQNVMDTLRTKQNLLNYAHGQVMQHYGGQQVAEAIANIVRKVKDENGKPLSEETALRNAGYYATAKWVPEANRRLIDKQTQYVLSLQEQLRTAEKANAKKLSSLIREETERLEKIQEDVANPDTSKTFFEGGVAGMSNAQAEALRAEVESQIPKELLEDVTKGLYRMNSWKVVSDVVNGRYTPEEAARMTRKPEIVNVLRDAINKVDKTRTQTDDTRLELQKEAKEAFDKAVDAVEKDNEYVPLTGNPDQELESQFLGSGVGKINQRGTYAMQGRKATVPDDGVTATIAGVNNSASYSAWRPFQNAIADFYNSFANDEAKKDFGIYRKTVNSETLPVNVDAIIRKSGNKQYQIFTFKDQALISALQNDQANTTNAFRSYFTPVVEMLGGAMKATTRTYAMAATWYNPTFAPRAYFGDILDRYQNILNKQGKILNTDGQAVDVKKIAKRALSYAINPKTVANTTSAVARYLLNTRDAALQTHEDALLQEFIQNGGQSLSIDRFSSSRESLVSTIANQSNNLKKIGENLSKWVHVYNGSLEITNALSSYRALREEGVAPKTAAAATLDLLNFQKKGASMNKVNSLYAFAQPAMMGAFNMLSKYYDFNTGKIRARGFYDFMLTTALLTGVVAFMRSASPVNKAGNLYDQQPDSVKNSYLLIPNGKGGFYKLYMGFGYYRMVLSTSNHLLDLLSGVKKTQDVAGSFLNSLVPLFTPLDSYDVNPAKHPLIWAGNTFAPTALQSSLHLLENRNHFGDKIVYSDENNIPTHAFANPSSKVAPAYKTFARHIYNTTGVDVAPEAVKNFVDETPLGLLSFAKASFIDNPYAASQGKEVANPLLSQIYRPANPDAFRETFQNAFDEASDIAKTAADYENATNDQKKSMEKPKFSMTERRKIAWYKDWKTKEGRFSSQKAKITKNTSFTQDQRTKAIANINKQQREAMLNALQKYDRIK